MESQGNSGPRGNRSTWDCDLKLGSWLQQILGTTSKLSVQKTAVLKTAERYRAEPSSSQVGGGAWMREEEQDRLQGQGGD